MHFRTYDEGAQGFDYTDAAGEFGYSDSDHILDDEDAQVFYENMGWDVY